MSQLVAKKGAKAMFLLNTLVVRTLVAPARLQPCRPGKACALAVEARQCTPAGSERQQSCCHGRKHFV